MIYLFLNRHHYRKDHVNPYITDIVHESQKKCEMSADKIKWSNFDIGIIGT